MTSRNSNKSSYLPDQIEWNVPNSIETYDGTANDCAVSVLTGEHFDGDLNCPNEKSHNNNTTIDNNKEKKADPLEIKEVKKSDSDDSHPCTNSTSSGTTPQDATIMSCYDTFSRTWTRTVRSFQRPIRKTMASVAVWSASHPLFVVVLSLSLSICLMVTGYFTNFVMIEDEVQLWGMQGSMLLKDREWVKNVFVPASREDDANYVTILVHKNGDNVITKDGMRTVLNILDRVRNNNDTGYQDFCGKYGSNLCTPRRSLTCILSGISIEPPTITCPIYGLTTAWLHNTTIFETMVESDDDVRLFFKSSYVALNSDDKPWTLDLESFVSFPEFHADTLVAAKSLTTHIRLPREYSNRANERDVISQEATMLEKNIIKTLQQLHLEWEGDFAFEFHSSLYDEFHRDIFREILLLPVLFIVLVLLTALLSCKHSDRGFSQIFLGIGSVICVASSVLSGYGIMFVIGVPFTYLALASVFVVFVVGLVDAFVIYNAFLQTDVKENVLERTYKSMEEAGMGIFISSTTAIIAFSIGALSNIQAIRWLSLYAFSTIASNFCLQITFFVALIALDQRRLQSRRKGCWICLKTSSKFSIDDRKVDSMEISAEHDRRRAQQFDIAVLLMQSYSEFLMHRWVKITVLVIFLEFLLLSLWSASKLQVDFAFQSIVPSESYQIRFARAEDEFTRQGPSPYIYFRNVDQSDPVVQEQMEAYVFEMANIDSISNPPHKFWLIDYKKYIANETSLAGLPFNETLSLFLSDEKYEGYKNDMMLDGFYRIEASRTLTTMDSLDLSEISQGAKALTEQWKVSSQQPMNENVETWQFFMFDELFIMWEFLSALPRHITITFITAICSVTVMSLLFLPHWSGWIFSVATVVSLYIEFLGILQFADIAISGVSFACVSMAIGLLVDSVMHVSVRFYESTLHSRNDRTKDALTTIGPSVLLGGISAFLSMIPLLFSTNDFIQTLSVSFMSVVVLGLLHGLILLPVTFSVIGPATVIQNLITL